MGHAVITHALSEAELDGALGTHARAQLARNDLDWLANAFGSLARRASMRRLRVSRAPGVSLVKATDHR